MKSREFRSRLADAARLVARTGHEAGFSYFENYLEPSPNRKAYWTPVIEGGPTEIELNRFDDYLRYSADAGFEIDDHLPLLAVHFHARLDADAFAPSRTDVESLLLASAQPDIDYRPVFGIAAVSDTFDGACLLLQAPRHLSNPAPFMADWIDQVWSNYQRLAGLWPSSDYTDWLQVPGLIAGSVLGYTIPARSKYATFTSAEGLDALCGE